MKIKKKDLRKGLPQLPINYPAPSIGDSFDYETEKHRVEDICKRLSHNEVEVRDAVLGYLPQYLKEVSESFTESRKESSLSDAPSPTSDDLELLLQKLCLGIFYCYWHSDKPLVQHECAFSISKLCRAPSSPHVQLLFIRSLFLILSRQWGKIDHYRLDKYMSLVRKILYQCFILSKGYYENHSHLKGVNTTNNSDEDAQSKNGINKTTTTSQTAHTEGDQTIEFDAFTNALITIFQEDIILQGISVGLTMHLMDIFLDELIRSDVPVPLFVHLSECIPLYAMSKGNYVEKKVLDMFITPIVSGVLDARRVLTVGTSPEEEKKQKYEDRLNSMKKSRNVKKDITGTSIVAQRDYSNENDEICHQLSEVCKSLSVARSTKFLIRTMFVESQALLLQRLEVKLNPQAFKKLTKKDMQRRIAGEIEEAESTRERVMQHRKVMREEHMKDKLAAKRIMQKEAKERRETKREDVNENTNGEKDLLSDEERPRKKEFNKNEMKIIERSNKKASKMEIQPKLRNKRSTNSIIKGDCASDEITPKLKKLQGNKVGKLKTKNKSILGVKSAVVRLTSSNKKLPDGVSRQLERMRKKKDLEESKQKRINHGEKESRISVKGHTKNSKRKKNVKITSRDLLDEAKKASIEDQQAPDNF